MSYSMRFRADELWVSTKRGVHRRGRKLPVIKRWLKARDAGRFLPLLLNSIMQSTLFIVYICDRPMNTAYIGNPSLIS